MTIQNPDGSASPRLDAELLSALERLAAVPSLLVALDFDGTLAPLVDNPDDARAVPEARSAVLRLAELPNTSVALISGRAMESLIRVSEPSEAMLLSGSHGVETRLAGESRVELDERELADLDRLRELLDGVAARFEGAWIESKPAGFALHTRLASPEDAAAAQGAARDLAVARLPELTVRAGNNVLEFSVRSTTKGDAVRMLRGASEASAVLFAGDDVTDEDGFAALGEGDLGIKCGTGATAAHFRVPDIDAIARVLQALADLRR